MSIETADQVLASNEAPEVQTKQKEVERALIRSMAGTYRVSFQFAETFAPDKAYEYHERKFAGAKEIVEIIEESDDRISLQHLLYVGKGHIIKHWRQDWVYENKELFVLVKGHEWKKIELTAAQAKGTWTQKVFQVDDAPRYEGFGTWVHVDGRHFWESEADSALPRREISKRSDYNVLKRHSHIEIFNNGDWVLDQDNEKIIRAAENEDTLLCMEKGIEKFTRKEYDPQVALDFWNQQAAFWADVRTIWEEIRVNQNRIAIDNDEKLYMAQFDLASQFTGDKYNSEQSVAEINSLLAEHVKGFKG